MLWLALHLPNLPFDALGLDPAATDAWVVVERQKRQEQVIATSATALAFGVRIGMRRSAAQALAANLHVAKRQPEQELAMLASLASWAMQFTPTVCIDPPSGLLLEIQGCLGYFKGLPRLLGLVSNDLQALALEAHYGLAPTPLAASWFAQLGIMPVYASNAGWQEALAQLPLAYLPIPERTRQQLLDLGLREFGELKKLPSSGLALRFGVDLLDLLGKATGNQPDPRQPFVPPNHFERHLVLNWHIDHVEALGFVIRRLLVELAAFLIGRGLGVQQVMFHLLHEGGAYTKLPLGFGKLTRSAENMFAIARERLTRCHLPASVHGLVLLADKLHRLDSEAIDLFGDSQTHADFDLLQARLCARLGEAAIHQLACVADHRPERAWGTKADTTTAPATLPDIRPGWLLAQPIALQTRNGQPWYGEPLTQLGHAERIETGWWEGESVARDYFQAQGPSGRRYWIYQQRLDGAWFLHGLFG
ncbi:Y-family DNA polymerase [Chitinimonas sp. PSY-7]|uniref:Y-family DNA polymerase n=1 Tax=Chitinimonas sp. PSY-7 TaxID=3459088 RepID=UPI00403FF505